MSPSTLGGSSASCAAGNVPPEFGQWEVRPDPHTYNSARSTLGTRPVSFSRAMRPLSAPPCDTGGGKTGPDGLAKLGPGSYSLPSHLMQDTRGTILIKNAQGLSGRRSGAISERRLAEYANMPGPGAYPMPAYGLSGKPISIGNAARMPPDKDAALPGPGKYGLPPDRCTTNARPSRAPRLQPRRRSASCGLGGGRREAFRARRRKMKGDNGPGPGDYSQEMLPGPKRSATIGTGLRPPLNPAGNNVPGPGMYGVPNRPDQGPGVDAAGTKGRSFTRSTDPPVKFNNYPGPGYYKAYHTFA